MESPTLGRPQNFLVWLFLASPSSIVDYVRLNSSVVAARRPSVRQPADCSPIVEVWNEPTKASRRSTQRCGDIELKTFVERFRQLSERVNPPFVQDRQNFLTNGRRRTTDLPVRYGAITERTSILSPGLMRWCAKPVKVIDDPEIASVLG